ncbi:MAG: hypothetical protein IM466_06850 [Microcystis sp. M04BS1]|nr:hypothetical protein [Microcystis sp. M04BS1]
MKDKISNNKFAMLIVLIFSSLIVYKMSSAFYSLVYNNMISWNNFIGRHQYNPLYYTINDYNIGNMIKTKSIEEIDKIINDCETGKGEQSIENYQYCSIAYNKEAREFFEEYKDAFTQDRSQRNSFVFNRSVITTEIIVLLLYLYLKQGTRGKTLIPIIISSLLTYVVIVHFYKIFYSTLFHYPPKPDNTNNSYDLRRQYVFSGPFGEQEKIEKFALEKIIKEQGKAAQNCQAQAQIIKEQADKSYQQHREYIKYRISDNYYYQMYQSYREEYEHFNECYQKNEQTKKTYEDYKSAIVKHEKNLEIFAFVMGIATTGTTNFFLYRFLRKKSQDEQLSSIDENQTHYYNYSSNRPKGLSFEEWLGQNEALQYFSEDKQQEAYRRYLESIGTNPLSFEEWLNQNPALQYFSEQQQRQAYQNYLSSLGGNKYS